MPKINVYLPDDLAEAVRESGVPVSAICQRALEQAVRRVTAIRETALGSPDLDDPAARLTHFTERARAAVKLAVERARAEGTAEVGTEHLLGGMLAEGSNLALHILRAMEIDPDHVLRELERPASGTPSAAPGASPLQFSRSAAGALELAVVDATGMGHNYVGCEHLLLGLIAEPEGAGGRILRSLGAEPRLTRRTVSAALAGYVHLRAQTQAAGAPADSAAALSAAIRQELGPVLQRLDRLEARLGEE
ncbi:Clp protease N-terminal domain-containing protein [Streptosporangium sp. NPDC003464]